MKSAILAVLSCLSLVCLAESRTLAECNAELKELNAERLVLEKEIVVKYRKSDSPTANVSKRLKVVEINRNFVKPADPRNPSNYHEWFTYKNQIAASEKRLARLEEIKARIAEITREKSQILKGKK